MKKVGLAFVLIGGGLFFWCGQQLEGLDPVPQGVEPLDALKYYPAARFETGRYAGMAVLATGLLLFFMPTGRA
jgi:hypothetical protein